MHVEDISHAFLAVLEAPREAVHNQAFNVGNTEENYQIRDVADIVREAVHGCSIAYASGGGPDPRCYRVNCDKLSAVLPGFRTEWTVKRGVDDLYARCQETGLTADMFARYVRLKQIQQLQHDNALDATLRWQPPKRLNGTGSRGSITMKVVLFCGGLGMRIREARARAQAARHHRLSADHLARDEYYAHFGHKDFVLCLGYRGDTIKNYFLNYSECLSNDFVWSQGGKSSS